MNWLNKHLSLKADLIVTLLNGIIVIGGVFVLNGLIARIHGLDVLGEFLLIKRTLSAAVGILLVGMNIALPNYLSRNFEKPYGDNAFILFLIITVPMTILLIAGILLFNIKGFYSNQFWIYVLFSLGLSSQFITYALYRGYMNMVGANVFQLLGTAIIPIVVFTSVATLNDGLFWIGCSVTTIMVFAFLFRNKGIHLAAITFHHSKKIIIYGVERIPSFVAQFILLAGIPIYLAQKVNFESVAYFISSLSLVRLSLIIVNPVGLVSLPRISNKLASGSIEVVTNNLIILFKAGIIISLIGTTYIYLNASLILKFWLGEFSNEGVKNRMIDYTIEQINLKSIFLNTNNEEIKEMDNNKLIEDQISNEDEIKVDGFLSGQLTAKESGVISDKIVIFSWHHQRHYISAIKMFLDNPNCCKNIIRVAIEKDNGDVIRS